MTLSETDLNQITESICNAVTKAQCLWEWDNVNDPPCHPSDEDWKGCSSCYANREILAVAFRVAANHLRPEILEIGQSFMDRYDQALKQLAGVIVEELEQIAKHLKSFDYDSSEP